MAKRIVKLTESELINLVKKVLKEQIENPIIKCLNDNGITEESFPSCKAVLEGDFSIPTLLLCVNQIKSKATYETFSKVLDCVKKHKNIPIMF